MGTNFYATEHCLNPCAHCQRPRLHIGKRSGGWTFGFEAHPHWVDATREPWGPNGRQFRDPEGWDFWRGDFS